MRLLTTTALALAIAMPAAAQDWKTDYQVVKFGILSSENEQDRIRRWTHLEEYLQEVLGVEVEIFTAGNFDGVVQALAANQIEFAFLGSSSYAAAYRATNGGVTPLLTSQNLSGATGYYSIVVTRCDSGLTSLDDLAGKVLAFADPDSTSGYAVPYYNLVQLGYEPESFFSAVPFSGSHEAGVTGVVNGTFDAAATFENTDVRGIYQRMEEKGMIEAGQVCRIWKSPEITSGPLTARSNLPEGLVQAMTDAMEAFPEADPEGYKFISGFDPTDEDPAVRYVRVDHDRYQWIVDMREWLRQQRRS